MHTLEFDTPKYKKLSTGTHKDDCDPKVFYLPSGTDLLPRDVHSHLMRRAKQEISV